MPLNRSEKQGGSAASVSQHPLESGYTVKSELQMAARTMTPLVLWCLNTSGAKKQTKPSYSTTVGSI